MDFGRCILNLWRLSFRFRSMNFKVVICILLALCFLSFRRLCLVFWNVYELFRIDWNKSFLFFVYIFIFYIFNCYLYLLLLLLLLLFILLILLREREREKTNDLFVAFTGLERRAIECTQSCRNCWRGKGAWREIRQLRHAEDAELITESRKKLPLAVGEFGRSYDRMCMRTNVRRSEAE